MQQEYFEGHLAIQYPSRDESLSRIIRAVDVARKNDVPVVVVQHEAPEGSPVFAVASKSWELHPEVQSRVGSGDKAITKIHASVFAGTDLTEWLRDSDIDTLTFVGYMTNNCIVGSAAAAEPLGFNVEVLSDATGAIHMENEAGSVSARQVHETLMTVLHLNWAAVADTEAWAAATKDGERLAGSNLVVTAGAGAGAH